MRSYLLIARAFTAFAVSGVATGAGASATLVAKPPVPVIEVDGRGFGHGVGMAQDGALAMGKAGATTQQILDQFYPGTTLGHASGVVRVPLITGNDVELTFPDGGELRGAPAATVKVAPGGTVVVYRDARGTHVRTNAIPAPTTTTSTTTTPPPTLLPSFPSRGSTEERSVFSPSTTTSTSTTTPPPTVFSGVLVAAPNGDGRVAVNARQRRYRGTVEIAPNGNALRFVNVVPVETYLRGLGEVRNPSWPAAALRAQAIASRTYALRAMAASGEICDSQRCQVYIGSDAEYAAMNAAVGATSGQVLRAGKALASAVYSANGGCFSATREEGFGMSNNSYPYLRAAPYLCDEPEVWSETIALTDVAKRLRYAGTLNAVEVTERGPSGRALVVHLAGSDGAKTVSGLAFARALGLKSTLFSTRVTTAINPPALTGGATLQAPPEDAALHDVPDVDVRSAEPDVSVVRKGLSLAASQRHPDHRDEFAAGVASLLTAIAMLVRWRRQRQLAALLAAFDD